MTDQTLPCREAFEKAMRKEGHEDFQRYQDTYMNLGMAAHWLTWQTAWKTRAQSSSPEGGEAVAWQWRTKRGEGKWMHGWAISNAMPTRENCHLSDGDEIEVRGLYTRSNAQDNK